MLMVRNTMQNKKLNEKNNPYIIKNAGFLVGAFCIDESDILGEIIATDKNGNTSSYKIFSSKLDTVDKEIFIEINGNYYPAYESNKNK